MNRNIIQRSTGLLLNISCLLLVFSFVACSPTHKQKKSPVVENIIEYVSSSRMESTIADLVKFETRFPHKKQLEVADYLFDRLRKNIQGTEIHEYEYWGVDWKNVVGTIPGKKNTEQVVIVCAHLDSKAEKRLIFAPGADDDASGCAAVLELARILSKYSFEKTIKFILFSREETGQNGSKAYLKSIDRSKEQIVAAINLDMIAFGSDNEDIDLVTRPKHSWLAEEVYDLAKLYGISAKKLIEKGCY